MLCCFFQYKYSIYNTSVYLNTNHIRKRREERIERRWWEQKGGKKDVKWKEAMRWKLVVFGVLLKQCATSSSTATSSLQLLQFPTIICLVQFPLTFFPSFTPLFSASHAARNKRQRGGNEMWIKDSSLFLSTESLKETVTEREGIFCFLHQKTHRCCISDVRMTWQRVSKSFFFF